jgi:riboflavin kinase/FMN adenylyltransferase
VTLKAAQIIVDYREFPLGSASSICLGNFDGVHLGHQQILKSCLDSAKRYGLVSVAFTFFPHPSRVLAQGRSLELILTREERRELLELSGVDWILEQNFTEQFSKMGADDFAEKILFQTLDARSVVVGANFRFGQGAKGDSDLLKSKSFFSTTVVTSVKSENEDEVISSSRIRQLIQSGELKQAGKILGYPYFMTGQIVTGDQRGREMGFATANLQTDKECLPAHGVYLTISQDLETKHYFASLTNIGVRPTVRPQLNSNQKPLDLSQAGR